MYISMKFMDSVYYILSAPMINHVCQSGIFSSHARAITRDIKLTILISPRSLSLWKRGQNATSKYHSTIISPKLTMTGQNDNLLLLGSRSVKVIAGVSRRLAFPFLFGSFSLTMMMLMLFVSGTRAMRLAVARTPVGRPRLPRAEKQLLGFLHMCTRSVVYGQLRDDEIYARELENRPI